ncbi:hypothetical protein [Geoglobus acetivorans]|uniref:Uncharacterized protein n=1 Tax=Geoglobus acetivorans TaxID=565033 RepID=A0A0A7GGL0_GEOAI|nr:hypothetical protein GACE_1047 [Geoglobus acetivorans]
MDLLELLRMAKSFDGSPAELQSELRRLSENVVSVGDDLSFVVRFENELNIHEGLMNEFGGRKKRLYPFRNAWFFDKGYIAWDGRFMRVSRDIDEKILEKILASLNAKSRS